MFRASGWRWNVKCDGKELEDLNLNLKNEQKPRNAFTFEAIIIGSQLQRP
jgi:hypothetical protein